MICFGVCLRCISYTSEEDFLNSDEHIRPQMHLGEVSPRGGGTPCHVLSPHAVTEAPSRPRLSTRRRTNRRQFPSSSVTISTEASPSQVKGRAPTSTLHT